MIKSCLKLKQNQVFNYKNALGQSPSAGKLLVRIKEVKFIIAKVL